MVAVSRIGGRALTALLPDLYALPGPVYAALRDGITALVLDGRVPTDARLPSERELAAALRISRATVTAAYDLLRADGFLTSRTGSGSYVTVPRGARARTSPGRWLAAPGADMIDLSCATLPAPAGVLEPALAVAAAALPAHARGDGYDPAGLDVLRAAIADRFTARGAPTAPEQVLVTNGALHGFDLVLRLLLGPGDRVLTELPSFSGALDAIRGNGARVVPVPMNAAGSWDLDQLRSSLRQTAPRLAYLMPDFHNPTGALMDESDRREVLRAARQNGTTVVVDESFTGLGFRPDEPPCAALDPTVVSIGSLSKAVWGGLRIGWLRASADLVQRLAVLRSSIDMGGAVLEQLVAAHLLGDLDRILADRVQQLRPQRDALVAAVGRELPRWRVRVPEGGLSLWVELDAPLSTPLSLLAPPAGVMLVPGSRFGVDGTLERFLRLPYAQPPERLELAVQRIAGIWSQLDRTGTRARQLVVA